MTPGDHPIVIPAVTPPLVTNKGIAALRAAIADAERYAYSQDRAWIQREVRRFDRR